MDPTFVIALAIFLIFLSFILITAINFFVTVPESTKIIELRDKTKDLFDVFFGSGGLATDERVTTNLHRFPILLEETNGTTRTNEIVGVMIKFDEKCRQLSSWNNTVRVYDQDFNEVPSMISQQELCSSQYLNNSAVTFVVNMSANEKKRVYVYSINNTNTTAPSHSFSRPVGYWTFDEGEGTRTRDYSGNGNNGTMYNFDFTASSGWISGNSCRSGRCLIFDGVNDYVNITDSNSLDITNTITVEAWINLPGAPSGLRNILTKETATAGYVILFNGNSLTFSFYNGTSFQDLNYAGTWNAGQWYHLIGTYDSGGGTNNQKIYVDGVQRAQQTTTGNIVANNKEITIGYRASENDRFFNGTIDEVRIYNRVLTASEISSLANGTLTVTKFPQENITAISAQKVQDLTARDYQELKSAIGTDYNFRIEISEK